MPLSAASFVFGMMLFVASFGGALRYYLASIGLELVVYAPKIIAVAMLLIAIGKAIIDLRLPLKVLLVGVYLLYTILLGLSRGVPLDQVIFGAYVLSPLLFSVLFSEKISFSSKRATFLLILCFIGSCIGVLYDYYFDVPWRGFGYSIGNIEVEGNRDWSYFEDRRIAGFSRASFEAASMIFVGGIYACRLLNNRTLALALWLLTGWLIYITTSKGLLVSFAAVCILYAALKSKLRAIVPNSVWPLAAIILIMPIYGVISFSNATGNALSGDYILASFGERLVQMWPDAYFYVLNEGGALLGLGSGTIGVPLEVFRPTISNSADNVLLYFYVTIGAFAIFGLAISAFAVYSFGRISLVEPEAALQHEWLAAMGILVFGISTNVVESAILGPFLGLYIGRGFDALAGVPSLNPSTR